jgi:hypothetical protein
VTNREVYKAVTGLSRTVENIPSLEAYLGSLWSLVSKECDVELTAEKFVEWVTKAFVTAPPPFQSEWSNGKSYLPEAAGFEAWENRILYQVADLHKMAEAGMLDDESRYFGINSPSGSRWYNFDPLTYLECGVRGELGGYVEDEVIVLIQPAEGESADSPVFEIVEFTWDNFTAILECGQMYE